MKKQELTSEKMIAQIKTLKEQVKKLKVTEYGNVEMETALRASDERFRFLFKTAPIGLSISNVKGDILNANKTLQELLGYSLKELESMNFIDCYADPNERHRLLDDLLKTNHLRNFETKFRHKDGSISIVSINSDYIDLDEEKVLLTSIYDMTKINKMQDELSESEKLYHLLFNSAPVGITVTDYDGNITTSNQAIHDILGYNAEEIKKKNMADFYLDKAERLQMLSLIEKKGLVRDFETRLIRKDGEVITIILNADIITLKGQNKGMLSSVRDITAIRRAEEILKNERDFTNTILETEASLVLVLDNEGRIARFNRACERLTGYNLSEVKGKHIWEVVSGNPEMSKNRVKEELSGNYNPDHESYWLTKKGERRLISWSSNLLKDQNKKVEYVISTGIDITEKRKAEMELQNANQKLANWVSDLEKRTAQMNLLTEMGEHLQSCQNTEEACAISAQYIRTIYPESHGAIYLIHPSKDLAEAQEMWGDSPGTQQVFLPMTCWSVRRSRPHLVDKDHPGMLCGHVTGPKDGQYMCIPMMAQGETMGILHLNNIASCQDHEKSKHMQYNEHKTQLVMSVADHIALALSNLKLRETLRQQSIRDILTGLFNRRYMEETLSREIHRAEREKRPIGMIMFDIDRFKEFNDLSGHDGGDALLRELGVYLKKETRGGDIVCRYGGEEFVAVLPGADLENTRLRAEDLREGVKKLLVYHLGKPLGKCTISLGVAAFPQHGKTAEEILKIVDGALYRAKNEGRDRVVVASV